MDERFEVTCLRTLRHCHTSRGGENSKIHTIHTLSAFLHGASRV